MIELVVSANPLEMIAANFGDSIRALIHIVCVDHIAYGNQ